jgi:P27 family predicted phage terminase small subunit
LSAKAKRVWRDVVPVLKDMRILARVDRDALTAYCQTYARWRAAEEFIEKHGEIYPVRDALGNVRRMRLYPQVSIASTLLQVLRSYQQEFGMTPSARTRVHEIQGPVWDSIDERFFGPKPPYKPPKGNA